MKEEIVEIKGFFKKYKSLIIYTIILTAIIYGIKIVNTAYGMDTNGYLIDYKSYLKHWISIGRFGEVLLKVLLWGPYTNIYLLNILSFILFTVSTIMLCFLCYQYLPKKEFEYKLFIIPSVFLTSQLFVFQFYFVLQNFEFSLGILLVICSIFLIKKNYQSLRNRYVGWFVSFCMLTLAISIYQSFAFFFVGVVISIILLWIYKDYQKRKLTFKEFFFKALPYIFILFLALITYFGLDKLIGWYFGIARRGHEAETIIWGKLPLKDSLHVFLSSLRNVIFSPYVENPGIGIVYKYGFFIASILIIMVILKMIISKYKNTFYIVLSLGILVLSGLALIFVTGNLPVPRSMVPQYPFMLAFLFFYASLFFNKKLGKALLVVGVLFVTFSQVKTSSNLVMSEQMTFEEDQRKIMEINQAINNLGLENQESYKLMIVGCRPPKNRFAITPFNELIGVSMFQFGYSSEVGAYYVNVSILSIMNMMGMPYQVPSYEEYIDYWKNRTHIEEKNTQFAIEVIDHTIIVRVA